MSDVNWEGLLGMWKEKLATTKKLLTMVNLSSEESDNVLNLYLPEHCSPKHEGSNMISDDDLKKIVEGKRNAKAFLLFCCPNITSAGIFSSLKILNNITLLVLDEVKMSHEMMMVVADNVKTLRIISLFSYVGDVSDDSIEAVAKHNKGLEWFILPGFPHKPDGWKMTSKAVLNIAKHCTGLKKISMPTCLFADEAVKAMYEFLQPDLFELLTVRRYGKWQEINVDLLKQLFKKFHKLRAEDIKAELLRKAEVRQGFEVIEIGNGENERTVKVDDFLALLNGNFGHVVKKLSIPYKWDKILQALIDKGLHNQIKELDFGIGFDAVLPKSTLCLLAKFTSLENLNLGFHLGEGYGSTNIVTTDKIVQLLSNMTKLKKLDLSWSSISPKGVEKVVNDHPLLEDLKMEGCGGEHFDYSDFSIGLMDVACLNRPGLNWSSRNKYGERSGMYQEQASFGLEQLGMDTEDLGAVYSDDEDDESMRYCHDSDEDSDEL
jgi:hypothetical protein